MAELRSWCGKIHDCSGGAPCETEVVMVRESIQGLDRIRRKWRSDAHPASRVGCADTGRSRELLPDVVRNAICTHSHPTGLMGAVLHALCVGRAIADARCPASTDLAESIAIAERLPKIMANDVEFGYWHVAFEQVAGDFGEAWAVVVEKTREAVRKISTVTKNMTPQDRYKNMVNGLRLRDPERRGSGMLTAVAATALAWCEPRPAEAMRIAANEVGTDTDTIATMAGAIVGAAADADPPVEVIDADLFRSEADRLATIAAGGYSPPSHQYPDLLRWSAPASRADARWCHRRTAT